MNIKKENIDALYEKVKEVKKLTHAELKSLRSSRKLVIGQWYRITDYVTTTAQAHTQSAGHPFDILVMATATNSLSEEAFAIQHEGDTYFRSTKMSNWQLRYTLDNDTTRFQWADTENGRGVIYRMRDEFGNEAGYDFKNIQYKMVRAKDYFPGREGLDLLYVLPFGEGIQNEIEKVANDDTFILAFTFSSSPTLTAQADMSMNGKAMSNVISEIYNANEKFTLPKIIIFGKSTNNRIEKSSSIVLAGTYPPVNGQAVKNVDCSNSSYCYISYPSSDYNNPVILEGAHHITTGIYPKNVVIRNSSYVYMGNNANNIEVMPNCAHFRIPNDSKNVTVENIFFTPGSKGLLPIDPEAGYPVLVTKDKSGNIVVKNLGSTLESVVETTYEALKDLRDDNHLLPGQLYRITDYLTTVNGAAITNARSAGHQFDILVRADSASTLNEQAWAVRHEGDTYFKDARLEAWELKYRLDNVQWSKQVGTYVTDEDNGYTFQVIGDITLSGHTYKLLQGIGMYVEDWSDYALMETVAEGEQIICYYGDPEEFDPDEPEVIGTASGVEEVTEAGKGTIVYMKDEWGNEAGYDFKNVQFKRWKVTDSMEGRTGFTDTYLGVLDNTAEKLSVEDAEDFIWAYTFSSDAMGGEQTDYSLDGTHSVYDNIIKEKGDGSLPDNVFFGENCYANTLSQNCWYNSFSQYCHNNSFSQYCYNNSFSQNCWYNSFSQDCYNNSFSQNCQYNSFSQGCSSNSFSQGCSRNSFSQNCWYNSFSQNCWYNSFSQDCYNNSFSQDCYNNSLSQGCSNNSFSQNCWYNSFSQNCSRNSFSQDCYNNSFSQNVQYVKLSSNYMQQVIVESGNQHLNVVCNQSTSSSQPCRNIKIEQGVGNTTSEKTVTITTRNQNYQTVVKNANSVEMTA